MVGIEAPSIRLKALRLPPSSRIATFSVTPSSLAFATAASTIFCASSEEMLCFFTTSAIGITPHLICFAPQTSLPTESTSRELHRLVVHVGAPHRLGAIDADRVDLDTNLGRARGWDLRLEQFENFRSPGL